MIGPNRTTSPGLPRLQTVTFLTAGVRPSTGLRDGVIAAYGRWLGFVAESEPSTLAEHPVERLTRERVLRYLDHLAETAGTVGRWAFFQHLSDAIRVMFPGKAPDMLHQLVRRLKR